MTRKKASDWEDLITEAACSGIDIPEFCSLHGFSRSWFYRMARRLGYMDGGKRCSRLNKSDNELLELSKKES